LTVTSDRLHIEVNKLFSKNALSYTDKTSFGSEGSMGIDINAKRPDMLQVIDEILCCNPS